MKKMRTALFIIAVLSAACSSPSLQTRPRQSASAIAEPQDLCARVAEIKKIPFKDEKVDDAVYNALINAGDAVLPCLIDKVADSTPMRDPRSIPGPTDTRVGDVAFFVLMDIAKLDFESVMPPEVKKVLKEEGVYAYHRFMSEPSNRLRFQSTLREWYRQKYGT